MSNHELDKYLQEARESDPVTNIDEARSIIQNAGLPHANGPAANNSFFHTFKFKLIMSASIISAGLGVLLLTLPVSHQIKVDSPPDKVINQQTVSANQNTTPALQAITPVKNPGGDTTKNKKEIKTISKQTTISIYTSDPGEIDRINDSIINAEGEPKGNVRVSNIRINSIGLPGDSMKTIRINTSFNINDDSSQKAVVNNYYNLKRRDLEEPGSDSDVQIHDGIVSIRRPKQITLQDGTVIDTFVTEMINTRQKSKNDTGRHIFLNINSNSKVVNGKNVVKSYQMDSDANKDVMVFTIENVHDNTDETNATKPKMDAPIAVISLESENSVSPDNIGDVKTFISKGVYLNGRIGKGQISTEELNKILDSIGRSGKKINDFEKVGFTHKCIRVITISNDDKRSTAGNSAKPLIQGVKFIEPDEATLNKLGIIKGEYNVYYYGESGTLMTRKSEIAIGNNVVPPAGVKVPPYQELRSRLTTLKRDFFPVFISDISGEQMMPFNLLKKDFVARDFLSKHSNTMVPVMVRTAPKTEYYHWDNVVFWFEPTDEFFDLFPAEIGPELKAEYRKLNSTSEAAKPKSVVPSCTYFEACRMNQGALSSLFTYPNPASTDLNVMVNLGDARKIKINLLDLSGRPIKELLPLTLNEAGNKTFSFTLDGISSGVYLLLVESAQGEQAVQRIVVNK